MIVFFETKHSYKIFNPGEIALNEYWEILQGYGSIV